MALALIVALWAPWRSPTHPAQPALTMDIDLGTDVDFTTVGYNMILSPDASRLIVVSRGPDGTRLLYRRNLNTSRAEPVPGTEGAYLPFFSPDGEWVGFFASGKLKKVPVAGGVVVTLCDAPAGRGGTWGDNGSIVAALDTRVGLSILSAEGGTPVPLTELNAARRDAGHRLPHFVPGSRAVIFTASSDPSNYLSADISVVTLADRRVKILLEGVGSDGRYIGSGHLAYLSRGQLFAASFDRERLEVTGTPIGVLDGIMVAVGTGTGQLDLSANGHLVFQRGSTFGTATTLQWIDERGTTEPVLPAGDYQFPALSPDGGRLVVSSLGGIWVHDWQQGRQTRLTSSKTSSNSVPMWTPDGQHVIFRSSGEIFWTRADGASEPQPLVRSTNFLSPLAVTPDGKNLAYSENARAGTDLMIAPLEVNSSGLRAGRGSAVLRTPSSNVLAGFSPDGRWLAYTSAKSGTYEVYVRAFPDNGSERLVSSGGHMPLWSRNGRELFYRTDNGRLMVVSYSVRDGMFVADKPRTWWTRRLAYSGLNRNFDLSPDGKRLVATVEAEGPELQNHALLVVNFFDEVRRRVAAGGK